MDLTVIGLFPTPLGLYMVSENVNRLQSLKDYDFRCTHNERSNAEISKSVTVLDDFPEEKEIIFSHFNDYKNQVFRLEEQKFEMTTSWVTRIKKGGFSQFHSHLNVAFSGVLYLDGNPDDDRVGPLEFEALGILPHIYDFKPVEENIYTSHNPKVVPQKNLLVFFPSYLRHAISLHTSPVPRHSVAFNFAPVGQYGGSDSTVNVRLEGIA